MPFNLDRFIRTRPRLFHLTATENVHRITRTGGLTCASSLYREAGTPARARVRRKLHDRIKVGRDVIHIRDQGPLHANNAGLAPGWKIDDLVMYLNDHVFFWPGTEEGPVASGRNHFERYAADDCKVLELDTEAVFGLNNSPLFCKFNSGSPRFNNGTPSPRGPDTFQRHCAFLGTASNVVDVTFTKQVVLPKDGVVIRDLADFV